MSRRYRFSAIVIYGFASWMLVACGGGSQNSSSVRGLSGSEDSKDSKNPQNPGVIDNGAATNARRAAGREEWEKAKAAARNDFSSRSNSDPLVQLQRSSANQNSGESSGSATDVPKGLESSAITDGLMFVGMAGLGMYLMNGGIDFQSLIPKKGDPAAPAPAAGASVPNGNSIGGNSVAAAPSSSSPAVSAQQASALFKDPQQLMATIQKRFAADIKPEDQNQVSDQTQPASQEQQRRSSGSGDITHEPQNKLELQKPQAAPDSACPPQTTTDSRLGQTHLELQQLQDQVSAKLSLGQAQEGSTK